MRIEISHVLVDEHITRLRNAAQAPSPPFATRVWAVVRRRPGPPPAPPVVQSEPREIDRLAA